MPPFRDTALTCPACPARPTLVDDGRGVAACPLCGGRFMPESVLLARLRAAQPAHAAASLLEHNDGSPRRACPACGERMTIVWLEFLQLDRCDAHGVWLDPGELERALRWEVVPADLPRPRRY